MTEPARRPLRPPVLVGALVALPLAALLFAMTETNLGGQATLPSVTLVVSLLAIRFNWARVTSVAALAFLTVLWLPGGVVHLDEDATGQAAIYVLVGTVVFVVGAVLAFLAPSNRYYQQAAHWRHSRRQQAT